MFSKVTIAADNDVVLLGVAGFRARARAGGPVRHAAGRRTPGGQDGETTILHFSAPAERFLLVTRRRGRTADWQTA